MFVKSVLVLCVAAVSVTAFELGNLDVIFHLYTRENPSLSQPLLPSIDHILMSNLSPQRKTIVTIHSNGDNVGGNFNAWMVKSHLEAEDVNVLALDWSRGSGMYTQGLGNALQCGERIALFINILIGNFAYNPNLIRIVGAGLGGHIAGIAARHVNGNIPHIIACDPSLFGWTHNPHILSPNDANVVEVIHTTAGYKGYDNPLGDLDFYPGGGSFQNGCFGDIDCSHELSFIFYAESITQTTDGGNKFVGTKCDDYEAASNGACNGDQDAVFGGTEFKESGSGIYFFLTNFQSPYARG